MVKKILIPTTVRAQVRFLYDRKYVSTASAKRIILYLSEFIFYTTAQPSPMVALQRREVHAKKFVVQAVVLLFYFYSPCVSKTVVVLVVLLIAVVVSIIKAKNNNDREVSIHFDSTGKRVLGKNFVSNGCN